ncbi:MAG: prolipoprotein diacylglyceryl transferase [Andreesenia angusta]|nr:prolipoprotein diacylglyceryl transferase [Andreesenia angusta]
MNPVAFEIFGFKIMWYGVLIGLAVVIGAIIATREAKRKGYDENTVLDLLLFAIPSALIGARLYYVIFSWELYRDNPISALNFRHGGLAIHGGLIGAVLASYIYCRVKNIKFLDIADIMAPCIILGQSIGRWGNYINQEAYGGPTDLPWAIEVDGMKVHPTFFYESVWDFTIFLFLYFYMRKNKKFDGQIFSLYLILYSLGRFFIEGLRTDSLMLGPIRVAQLISLSLILISTIFYIKKLRDVK